MSMRDFRVRLKVGKDGRCTIPAPIREDFDIREGDKLHILIVEKIREYDGEDYKDMTPYTYKVVMTNENGEIIE